MRGPPGATQLPQGFGAGPRLGVRLSQCPWATRPSQGPAGGHTPLRSLCTQAAEVASDPPQKLRLCSWLALSSPSNPVEIALRKLLSCTPWLHAPPLPGTIPVPCLTSWESSLLIFASCCLGYYLRTGRTQLITGFWHPLSHIWGGSSVSLHKAHPCGHLSSSPVGSWNQAHCALDILEQGRQIKLRSSHIHRGSCVLDIDVSTGGINGEDVFMSISWRGKIGKGGIKLGQTAGLMFFSTACPCQTLLTRNYWGGCRNVSNWKSTS